MWDVFFGSLATLIGAVGTYLLRKHKVLMFFPPILANMIIVPFVLRYGYGFTWMFHDVEWSIPYFALTVGIGEIISVGILGSVLLKALLPYKTILFSSDK